MRRKRILDLNYFCGLLKLLINSCILRFVIVKENPWNGWNATALDAVNRRDPRLSELFNYFGMKAGCFSGKYDDKLVNSAK